MSNTFKSFAKINLFLNTLSRFNNGYHQLESIVSRIDLYDEIEIKHGSDTSISFDGPFGSEIERDNNISKLFRYLINKNYLSEQSFSIHIKKNIPVGSGLGGGSSNIAEIIKYLININLLNKSKSIEIARDLGSDVEFFLEEDSALISGKGEVDQRLKIESKDNILILFPKIPNSTEEIFQNHDELSIKKFTFNKNISFREILKSTSNVLEKTALSFNQEMSYVKDFLNKDNNCKFERMTGTGSAYFGIYQDKSMADEAIIKISREYPNWWTHLTKII